MTENTQLYLQSKSVAVTSISSLTIKTSWCLIYKKPQISCNLIWGFLFYTENTIGCKSYRAKVYVWLTSDLKPTLQRFTVKLREGCTKEGSRLNKETGAQVDFVRPASRWENHLR